MSAIRAAFRPRCLALLLAGLSLVVLLSLSSPKLSRAQRRGLRRSPPRNRSNALPRTPRGSRAAAPGTGSVAPLPATATLARAVAERGLDALATTLAPDQDLLVTFGSMALAPFISSLLSALARVNVSSVLVGALDAELYAACIAVRVPVLLIEGGVVQLGGSAAADGKDASSGYFRKDFQAFKKMGARKARFLARLLGAAPRGLWVCDADVSFLRAPPPQLVEHPLLRQADVLLSTDCIDLCAPSQTLSLAQRPTPTLALLSANYGPARVCRGGSSFARLCLLPLPSAELRPVIASTAAHN